MSETVLMDLSGEEGVWEWDRRHKCGGWVWGQMEFCEATDFNRTALMRRHILREQRGNRRAAQETARREQTGTEHWIDFGELSFVKITSVRLWRLCCWIEQETGAVQLYGNKYFIVFSSCQETPSVPTLVHWYWSMIRISSSRVISNLPLRIDIDARLSVCALTDLHCKKPAVKSLSFS